MTHENPHYTAFAGSRRIGSGTLAHVARQAKDAMERGEQDPVVILDDETCRLVEVDFRGSAEDVVRRLGPSGEPPATEAESPPRGPGRPKLGVVAREVTLLPRHWDWLNRQPGGASVALRKLVEDARRSHQAEDRQREAQEALYRFMAMMAGDHAGFEEASRSLFAGNPAGFAEAIRSWPEDVRAHAQMLARRVFESAA